MSSDGLKVTRLVNATRKDLKVILHDGTLYLMPSRGIVEAPGVLYLGTGNMIGFGTNKNNSESPHLKRKRWVKTPADVERDVIQRYKAGDKVAEIRWVHDLSPGTLYSILHRHHVELREGFRLNGDNCQHSVNKFGKNIR